MKLGKDKPAKDPRILNLIEPVHGATCNRCTHEYFYKEAAPSS